MPIHFACPKCGERIAASDADAGYAARCPECGAECQIPSVEQPWKRPGGPRKRTRTRERPEYDRDVPPSPWLKVLGWVLIVWGVGVAITASMPTDPNADPAFRAGQAIGGCGCSLLMVAGGVYLARGGGARTRGTHSRTG